MTWQPGKKIAQPALAQCVVPGLQAGCLPQRPHVALVRCRVRYLGRAAPCEFDDGIASIQKPLHELYLDNECGGPERAVDCSLTVYTSGLLLEAKSGTAESWLPIQDLMECAALRLTNNHKFVPLWVDEDVLRGSQPPLFAFIFRRHDIPVSDCWAVMCQSDQAAHTLVHVSKAAYDNKAGWADRLERPPSAKQIKKKALPANQNSAEWDGLVAREQYQKGNGVSGVPKEFYEVQKNGFFYTPNANLINKYTLVPPPQLVECEFVPDPLPIQPAPTPALPPPQQQLQILPPPVQPTPLVQPAPVQQKIVVDPTPVPPPQIQPAPVVVVPSPAVAPAPAPAPVVVPTPVVVPAPVPAPAPPAPAPTPAKKEPPAEPEPEIVMYPVFIEIGDGYGQDHMDLGWPPGYNPTPDPNESNGFPFLPADIQINPEEYWKSRTADAQAQPQSTDVIPESTDKVGGKKKWKAKKADKKKGAQKVEESIQVGPGHGAPVNWIPPQTSWQFSQGAAGCNGCGTGPAESPYARSIAPCCPPAHQHYIQPRTEPIYESHIVPGPAGRGYKSEGTYASHLPAANRATLDGNFILRTKQY